MNYKFAEGIVGHDINRLSAEDCIAFFSLNRHSNIYVYDGDSYLGFLNMKTFVDNEFKIIKEKLDRSCIADFCDYKKDHRKIKEFFDSGTDRQAAPVFSEGRLIGEIKLFNRYEYSFDTQKKLNGLKKLDVYKDEIKAYISRHGLTDIGYICHTEAEGLVSEIARKYHRDSTESFEIILDCYLPREFLTVYNDDRIMGVDVFVSMCLLEKLKLENKIGNIYFINEPFIDKGGLYEDELRNLNNENCLNKTLLDIPYVKKVYGDYESDYDYISKLKGDIHTSAIVRNNGVYYYVSESVVNGDFANGERVTPSNNGFTRSIDIYGPCTAYSLFTSKVSSLSENLKRLLVENGQEYDVKNYAVPNGGDFLNDLIKMIYNGTQNRRLILFINKYPTELWKFISESGLNHFDFTDAFKNEHYCFFNQNMHFSPKGNRLAAEHILNSIDLNVAMDYTYTDLIKGIPDNRFYLKEKRVNDYLTYLKKNKFSSSGINGFIEMNASPFTNGHRYLIDYARQNCDHLYVFVTEDNRSALPFYDRFSMIKEYCDKYDNIKVLTGSDFIGSPFTITAYYNKKYDMKLNAVEDVLNFKELIIPILDIDIRFMGEEKNSVVTNDLNTAYLEFMASIGKETRVIPRLALDGTDISASSVRSSLFEGDYERLKKLVPEHVFEYLKNLSQEEFTEG